MEPRGHASRRGDIAVGQQHHRGHELHRDSARLDRGVECVDGRPRRAESRRSEEHTSELQSLMRNSYAVFCLKKKKKNNRNDKRERNEYIDTVQHEKTIN